MKPLYFVILLVVASTFAMADTWTGKLVDAVCKISNQTTDPSISCEATPRTSLFAIELPDTNIMNLDAIGNEKAHTAVKNGQKANNATVTGSRSGQFINVESLEVH